MTKHTSTGDLGAIEIADERILDLRLPPVRDERDADEEAGVDADAAPCGSSPAIVDSESAAYPAQPAEHTRQHGRHQRSLADTPVAGVDRRFPPRASYSGTISARASTQPIAARAKRKRKPEKTVQNRARVGETSAFARLAPSARNASRS